MSESRARIIEAGLSQHRLMEEKNRWTSVVLFLSAPFIFLIISNQGPPAVGLLLNEASWAPFAYYGVSFGIGYLLFRRSRVVKDMEWHRSKNIQRLDKVYRAEDRGVWLRADAADERLTVEAQRRPVDSRPKVAARLQGHSEFSAVWANGNSVNFLSNSKLVAENGNAIRYLYAAKGL